MRKSLKNFFRIRESDKHFLLALLAVTGVVFFWRGVWDVSLLLPIINDPFVSLFIGLVIMTFSGVIYREFIPEEEPFTEVLDIIKEAFKHPHEKRKTYVIEYYDNIAMQHRMINHSHIKKVEHNFLITERNGEEFFIPIHRVKKIHSEGKVLWKHVEKAETALKK